MSLLSWLQGDLNLNICEAHAFNTKDKFSLDVFVVNGWRGEVRSCTQQAGHSRQELPVRNAGLAALAAALQPAATAGSSQAEGEGHARCALSG